MSLSDKIKSADGYFDFIYKKDVREFIKEIKKMADIWFDYSSMKEHLELFKEDIDKLAGEKLIK